MTGWYKTWKQKYEWSQLGNWSALTWSKSNSVSKSYKIVVFVAIIYFMMPLSMFINTFRAWKVLFSGSPLLLLSSSVSLLLSLGLSSHSLPSMPSNPLSVCQIAVFQWNWALLWRYWCYSYLCAMILTMSNDKMSGTCWYLPLEFNHICGWFNL